MRWLVVGCLMATLVFGLTPGSQAAGKTGKTVNIAGTRYQDDGWVNYPQSCGPAVQGFCKTVGRGIVHWTGVFNGISEYTVYLNWDPDKQVFVDDTWERFTVTINGCGSGYFLTHQHKEFTPQEIVTLQDPTTGEIQAGEGTWRYVPGTATGDLAKLSSFWFTIKHIEFDPGSFANRGTLDLGAATC